MFSDFGKKNKGITALKICHLLSENFPKKSLNVISRMGFTVLFSDANSHSHAFCRCIKDDERRGITFLSLTQQLLKVFILFNAEIIHTPQTILPKNQKSHTQRLWDSKGNRKPVYAESFFLPLFLLLLMTFLPPVEAILFLNPCTLLLCLFLGWYVLFIVFFLLKFKIRHCSF